MCSGISVCVTYTHVELVCATHVISVCAGYLCVHKSLLRTFEFESLPRLYVVTKRIIYIHIHTRTNICVCVRARTSVRVCACVCEREELYLKR